VRGRDGGQAHPSKEGPQRPNSFNEASSPKVSTLPKQHHQLGTKYSTHELVGDISYQAIMAREKGKRKGRMRRQREGNKRGRGESPSEKPLFVSGQNDPSPDGLQ
jgi:hypothetical protein